MIFLNPTTDMAFKKLFSNAQHTDVVISFLNSILDRKEGEKIVSVTINDPFNLPDLLDDKMTIVDISCTDQKGNKYIIEMQARRQKEFLLRAQFYSAIGLYRQLASGEKYNKLMPVIFIGVMNFNLLKKNHYLSHHSIREDETNDRELKHLEYHFIELPKFNKTIDQLDNDADRWIFLLKNAETLRTIPTELKDNPVIEEAFTILEQGSWTEKELNHYEGMIKKWRNEQSERDTAREDGIEEGIKEGEQRTLLAMAKKLVADNELSIEKIATITGLTIDEIKNLKD